MSNFLFNTIRIPKLKRNKFNLSHDVKLSMRMGELIPIFCQDVIPGDTFKLNTEMLIRFAPLMAPVMHRINVYTHFFFVPKRLLWKNWKDFITGGKDGKAEPSYPKIHLNGARSAQYFRTGSLADYLGFPVWDYGEDGDNRFSSGVINFDIDALPFRAYSLIWNEYYRDQNLQDEIPINFDEDGHFIIDPTIFTEDDAKPGACSPRMLMLNNRAWTKDYFTSALPFAQRGNPVTMPLFGEADVFGSGYVNTEDGKHSVDGDYTIYSPTTVRGNKLSPVTTVYNPAPGQNLKVGSQIQGLDGDPFIIDGEGQSSDTVGLHISSESHLDVQQLADKLGVDLSKVSGATITELRNMFAAQKFLEAEARGGSRYIEYIRSIFGVKSSDARLQRPEYLGGGKQPVVVSDVMQTSQSTDTSALGTPGGAAASLGRSHSFKRYFEEYGYVIGIMSVMPTPTYQQGMPKMFTKFDRYDHYIPQFARIGEQEISKGELYFDPTTSGNDDLFGYAPRYAEYKFVNSSVHGDFRTSLKYWHMGRIFDSRPALNGSFVSSNPTDRVFAVTDEDYDKLWVNIHHNCTALRPMPKYGTPSI